MFTVWPVGLMYYLMAGTTFRILVFSLSLGVIIRRVLCQFISTKLESGFIQLKSIACKYIIFPVNFATSLTTVTGMS